MKSAWIGVYLIALSGCIGTDVLDDPLRSSVLIIIHSDDVLQLRTGESNELAVVYTNEFGIEEEVDPDWKSSNEEVAMVDASGKVTAITAGQSQVTATFNGTVSEPLLVNVTSNENQVSKVVIEAPKTAIAIGEMVQLEATAFNFENKELSGKEFTWEVDEPAIATINAEGLLTGEADGLVHVKAISENISSIDLEIQVGQLIKSAEFEGRSGYTASGTASLFVNDSGDLILELADNFMTDFALGTFIYLSNSQNGADTKSAGLELGEVTTNGAVTFNVTNIDSSVGFGQHRYVIVLCKPAAITFGVADFN